MSDIAIDVANLGKCYFIPAHRVAYRTLRDVLADSCAAPFRRLWSVAQGRTPESTREANKVWALKNFSLEVRQGEVLGVIGRNGSGKSTLLKILSRITSPTTGSARVRGRVGSLLEVGTGFHGELSGRDNVYLNGAILGMKRREIEQKFDEIVEFSQIGKFLDTPVKHYSSGMYMRLAFSVAAHLQSEILLVDEVLAVGDFDFQKKCAAKIHELTRTGKTVLFVSHNMESVESLCHRAVLLAGGVVQAFGTPAEVIKQYLPLATAQPSSASASKGRPPKLENQFVSLDAVSAHKPDGRPTTEFDITEEVSIRIAYRNRIAGTSCLLRVMLRDQAGAWVLSTQNPHTNDAVDSRSSQTRHAGLFETQCKIPGNLLNNQNYSVSVEIYPEHDGAVGDVICCENILSFRVCDSMAESSCQQPKFLGPVRPKVRWKTDCMEAA